MKYEEYCAKTEAIWEKDADVHTSPDFQCDQTEGFPVSLCVSWECGKAWLELNTSMLDSEEDAAVYGQLCADWGIRDCLDTEEFNRLLKGLGEDAYDNAAIFDDGGLEM